MMIVPRINNNYKNNSYEFKKLKKNNYNYFRDLSINKKRIFKKNVNDEYTLYKKNVYSTNNNNTEYDYNSDIIDIQNYKYTNNTYGKTNDKLIDNINNVYEVNSIKNRKVNAIKTKKKWCVHKFGGSSISTAENMNTCIDIIKSAAQANDNHIIVVLSAIGINKESKSNFKVTDGLITMLKFAQLKNSKWQYYLKSIEYLHDEYAKILLDNQSDEYTIFCKQFKVDIQNIKDMVSAVLLCGSTEKITKIIIGYGEIWSTTLFNLRLKQQGCVPLFMDTRNIITIDDDNNLHEEVSREKLEMWFDIKGIDIDENKTSENVHIITATGFIASNLKGEYTTLKRNGSDYSATILGSLLYAKNITIWTDVDGIYSADPNIVENASIISDLTYHEASELAYFGANIIHPLTTVPVIKYNIPIIIKNTFNPLTMGSTIFDIHKIKNKTQSQNNPNKNLKQNQNQSQNHNENDTNSIKGIATIRDVSIINIEGNGMISVPSIMSTVFYIIHKIGVHVKMITQSSSEYSLCFVVNTEDTEKIVYELKSTFHNEILNNTIQNIDATHKCSILAIIGNKMVDKIGIASRIMTAIANVGVNIKMISQGSSQYNITVLIDESDCTTALQSVHNEFFNN